MRRRLKSIGLICSSFVLVACTNTSEIDKSIQHHLIPETWQNNVELSPVKLSPVELSSVEHGWLTQLKSPQIHQLVNLALENNVELKQQALTVEMKKQQLVVSGADLWPSLDLSAASSRRKQSQDSPEIDNSSLDLNLKYELDLWGKLSAVEQQANLLFLAEESSFEQARQTLVGSVVTAWFAVIEAKQLVDLFQHRADNTQQNLEIIESGYRQGLNSALDVYLTRNEVNNELSRTAQQQALYIKNTRILEQLIGHYPSGKLIVDAKLPLLNSDIPQGLPSDLITRKPALMASWYQVLAQDAGLAYAHKQRFPSISLTASVGNSSDELGDLLSASTLGWSLLGNLSMPIFNAGKLEANEERERLALKQTEQGYLKTLHDAFLTVENSITEEASLKQRYQMMLTAQENAKAAQTLSFEQYQHGLVDYTTVLDAQSRSFDAQSTVIQIKNQLIANRIKLNIALGGDFSNSRQEVK